MKLWGGRFSKDTNQLVEHFHSSITFDQRLYQHDIQGSIAHAQMLGKQGIISPSEADQLIAGLTQLLADISAGQVEFDLGAEDIHMNVEKLLTELVGEVGKKLHTARSRNDQVALDMRMLVRTEIREVNALLLELILTLHDLATAHVQTIMPGYTHLQRAQPITLAHHLLAYVCMFQRDVERLQDAAKRVNVLPLGAGALAGTTFPTCPAAVAEELGFAGLAQNSLDAVSDRDFCIEFVAAASMIMMHLSRFSEEIILWSSAEFAFVELDDSFSTGSSIMPQKKNPDVAELVRGKTGRVYGDLTTLLTMMKGLPMAYNKDMQEDKEALFDAVDTVKGCLLVFSPMLKTARFRPEQMLQAAKGGFTNATDLADYLAKNGVAFRDAHEIVGKAVLHCLTNGLTLEQVPLTQYHQWSTSFGDDLYQAIAIETCVNVRVQLGGPAVVSTKNALAQISEWVGAQS